MSQSRPCDEIHHPSCRDARFFVRLPMTSTAGSRVSRIGLISALPPMRNRCVNRCDPTPEWKEAVSPGWCFSKRQFAAFAASDLDLDVLAEFQGVRFPECHLDEQDPRIGGPAGIFGTGLAGDDGVGDLFDLALPATAGISLRGDRRFRRRA